MFKEQKILDWNLQSRVLIFRQKVNLKIENITFILRLKPCAECHFLLGKRLVIGRDISYVYLIMALPELSMRLN